MLQLLPQHTNVLQQALRMPMRSVAAAAAKKQKPKRRKPKQPVSQRISYLEDEYEDEFEEAGPPAAIRLLPGTRVPKAPAPKAAPAPAAIEPEDVYPVFPKEPKAVERLPDSTRAQGNSAAASSGTATQQETPARLWNPRTGFMQTRTELEQQQQQQQQQAASGSSTQGDQQAGISMPQQPTAQPSQPIASSSSSWAGASSSNSSRVVERVQSVASPMQPPQLPTSALPGNADQAASGLLPAAGRGQVLASCAGTAAAMSAAAVGLSILAAKQSAGMFGTSQEAIDRLLQLQPDFQDVQAVGVMLGSAAVVTAARFVLLQQWPEFQEATERSNQQVLSSLSWADVVLVALLSGVSEELLFRWGLVSATWPDARGVLLSGAVFGVLHVGGGRNAAYAAWASAVGWWYGAAFLASGNVWVPAGAHAIANFASAAVWMGKYRKGGQ